MNVLVLAVGLCALSLVIWGLFWFISERGSKLPGPFRLPVFGNFLLVIKNRNRPLEWLLEVTEKFGLTWRGQLPGAPPVTFVISPQDVEHVLVTNFQNYVKGPYITDIGRDLLGEGIFNTNGESWRLQRKFAQPLFRHQSLQSMIPEFVEHARGIVRELDEVASRGSSIDVMQLFAHNTLDIICRLAFGIPLADCGAQGVAFAAAFDQAQDIIAQRFWKPFWKWLPEPGLKKRLAVIRSFAEHIIKTKREILAAGGSRSDILSHYLLFDEDGGFNDEYLTDVVMNILIAGRDTTAQTLTWACYLLSQHHDVADKVAAEAVRLFGIDGDPTFDQMKEMHYTRAVMEETLRLYPPVPLDPKIALADDELPSGYKVKAGSLVTWSGYCMGRCTALWHDPLTFKPERFLPSSNSSVGASIPTTTGDSAGDLYTGPVHPFAHIPFQAGPRQCLGMHMASLETRLVLAFVCRRFRFALKPGHRVAVRKSVTMPPMYGMVLIPQRR